jgi:hypothetical protein
MQTILDRAIETYRRQRFLEEVNAAYAALRRDEKAWEAWKEERKAWEVTFGDGIDTDETWTEDGTPAHRGKRGRSRA